MKFITGNPVVADEMEGVTVNPKLYIIYDRKENKLYFKKFSELNHIFIGIEKLYREATDSEIKTFFGIELIDKNSSIDKTKITVAKRKKILSALNTFNSKEDKEKLIEYGNKYHEGCFQNGKISIDSNEKLDIIHVYYYTSEVSGEKRKVNSVIKLG